MQVTVKKRGVCAEVKGTIFYSGRDEYGIIEIKAEAKVVWCYLLSEINWVDAYVISPMYKNPYGVWTRPRDAKVSFAMRPLIMRAKDRVMQSRFMRRNNDPEYLEIVEEEVKRLLYPLQGE